MIKSHNTGVGDGKLVPGDDWKENLLTLKEEPILRFKLIFLEYLLLKVVLRIPPMYFQTGLVWKRKRIIENFLHFLKFL